MTTRTVRLAHVSLPAFPLPASQPQVTASEYAARIDTARARAAQAGLDMLIVYGDREHFANITYLTDYDPRFEEALLLIPTTGSPGGSRSTEPILIVGNEGLGYAELCPLPIACKLYQGFSLLGQPRGEAPRLAPVLRECGVQPGMRLGLAGWKYFTPQESDDPAHTLDAPAFITDTLRALVGDPALVTNATALFMNPEDGLRLTNSADQLAAFEFAAAHCAHAVRALITGMRPGMTELEAVARMGLNGMPWTAHLMFSTGPRARVGLPSPMDRVIEPGDPFFVAFGLRGGLTARAGFVAAGAEDLPAANAEYLQGMAFPYYRAVVAWYEALGLGVAGGQVEAGVDDALRGTGIKLALNPGHYIHLDEWVHSPFFPGSPLPLRSGMLLQCDLIPAGAPAHFTANAEDTLALADEPLRAEIAARYPDLWARINHRRQFMAEVLGIHLKPEVLPFSDFPAVVSPFVLAPDTVLVSEA